MICVTPGNRSRNPRGEGDRLRDEVVDAAVALIAEQGPEALSLRAIARRAGITAPAIYSHFADLAEVRQAVVTSTFDKLADYLWRRGEADAGPASRLRALCRAYVEFGRAHPAQYAVLFNHTLEIGQARPEKQIENMQGREAFAILLDAIRACVDDGTSESTSPDEDAIAIWVALHGYVGLQTAVRDFPWPPNDALLDVMVDRLARLT